MAADHARIEGPEARRGQHGGGHVPFSVVELEGGTLIGTATLWGIDTHSRSAHIGLVREGVLRSSAWVLGTFLDEVLLGLLAEDWKPGPEAWARRPEACPVDRHDPGQTTGTPDPTGTPPSAPGTDSPMDLLDRIAFRTARAAAHRRGDRPALHPVGRPRGTPCRARPPGPRGRAVARRPGSYAVTARWSRGAGLPHPLPDGLGLALRVEDAGGPDRPLDLLLTTGGRGRWTRHVPLPRTSATAGPYSSLLSYVVGGRRGVVAAFPAPGSPRIPADPTTVGAAAARRPWCSSSASGRRERARPGGPWPAHPPRGGAPAPPDGGAFDPYLHFLPGFRPVDRLRSLRLAAYAGSRAGRHAPPPS